MINNLIFIFLFCLFDANSVQLINNFQVKKTTLDIITISSINLNLPNCGKGPSSSFRIVGGTKAKPGDWGWQALMIAGGSLCGGSLINSEWVVTAAHCAIHDEPYLYTFGFGVIDRLNPESWSEIRNVSEIHVHHAYSRNNTSQNDIALFKLSIPIEYSDYINPICIPKDSSSFAGKNAWATGWGKLSGDGPVSQFLMQVSVPFLNDTQCLKHYPTISPKIHVCAGQQNKTTCQGDSGGPLVVQNADDRWYLGGITSFSYRGCESVSVYARASYYYDWILSIIRDRPDGNSNSKILSLVVLKNGDLASGSMDSTIKIWNTDDGSLIRTLKGHLNQIFSLKVLHNGYLASASMDATIKIWNTNDGSLIRTLTANGAVTSLAVLQNGYLASGDTGKTIKIWNTNDGSLIRTLTGTSVISSLEVLQNGYLATGDMDATIKIWNTDDGSLIKTLTANGVVTSLAILRNGYLASGTDKIINIWNTDKGSIIKTLKGHSKQISSFLVLQNGDLVSGSYDSTIKIWNTDEATLLKSLTGNSFVTSLAELKNGYLASGSTGDSIIIWN